MIKDLCPGCGKHCYLDEARCERGAEYADTGVMPPRRPRPDGGHGKKHSEEKMRYLALDANDKIAWNIRELADAACHTEASALTEALREDDRTALLMLLEKVKFECRRRSKEQAEAERPPDGDDCRQGILHKRLRSDISKNASFPCD